MAAAPSPRRSSRIVPLVLVLGLLAGCDQGSTETVAPPPPAAAAPPPGAVKAPESKNNPGSSAATDSTLQPPK